ncbi:MAG: MerR family transcriptional regulator [Coprococcus sp.]|nr:MerR family transcriptional regulator [Coprococcus sp.]
MMDKMYSISEAAAKVEVETHVLRYWEEELGIDIKRNEMGHRYYEERDVKILQRVKTLKDKGIQLKAIKDVVQKMYKMLDEVEGTQDTADLTDRDKETDLDTFDAIRVAYDDMEKGELHISNQDTKIVDFKMAQFQNMMDKIIGGAIKDNLKTVTQSVAVAVTEDVVKQVDVLLKEREEQEEERYRKLDQSIRQMQQMRSEAAASLIKEEKQGIFRKKKRR